MKSSNRRARALAPLAITLAAIVIALALVAGVFSRQKSSPPTHTEEAPIDTVVIPVEGMSCVACAAQVKKTVRSLAGVGDVEVSLAERNVRVRFDPRRIRPDQVVAAINGLGYRAGTPTEAQ